MPQTQLQRLRQDVEELDSYITKLKEKGKFELIPKLERKRNYLSAYVSSRQTAMQ
jgi:hypothetical protein